MSRHLAILGLGTMGGRCAARAVEEGYEVAGYDPVPATREKSGASGVTIVDNPEAAARSAHLIIVSVPRPEQVAALASGPLLCAEPGSVVVDLSTIDPGTARQAAATLAADEITYLDTPVLGRPEGCGSWTLVAGGPEAAIAEISSTVVDTVAARVLRVGEVGAGSVVKLLNNLMFGAINAVTAEALTLCREHDVDPSAFVDAVAGSGAATVSNLFREIAPRMIAEDHEPIFSLDLLAKDNRLALELAKSRGVTAPVAATVDRINGAGIDGGLGDQDTGALHRIYANLPEAPT